MQDQLNLAQKKENARETEWKTWTANLVKSNQEALMRAIGNAEQSRVQLMRCKESYTPRNSLTSAGGSFNPKDFKCYYCDKTGHVQDDCEHKKRHL